MISTRSDGDERPALRIDLPKIICAPAYHRSVAAQPKTVELAGRDARIIGKRWRVRRGTVAPAYNPSIISERQAVIGPPGHRHDAGQSRGRGCFVKSRIPPTGNRAIIEHHQIVERTGSDGYHVRERPGRIGEAKGTRAPRHRKSGAQDLHYSQPKKGNKARPPYISASVHATQATKLGRSAIIASGTCVNFQRFSESIWQSEIYLKAGFPNVGIAVGSGAIEVSIDIVEEHPR